MSNSAIKRICDMMICDITQAVRTWSSAADQ